MVVIARAWALSTEGCESYLWWATAVALAVGFCTLLRPGELLSLTKDRVVLPVQVAGDTWCPGVVVLINPKNKRFMGTRQFALVEEPDTVRWLEWWTAHLPPQAPLFRMTRVQLSNRMDQLLSFLGCRGLRFTPGSLRAGGATHHFMTHRDIGRLQYQGRWRSSATLSCYLQEAVAAAAWGTIPPAARHFVICARALYKLTAVPPAFAAPAVHGKQRYRHRAEE
jgi:hypothetical protein